MAKEDFCFTYYDGDALRDMSHMNRLERGGYNDIVLQQRKFGWLTLEQIQKILGRDFSEIWPAINLVLIFDEIEKKFYVDWLHKSVLKMRTHSKLQKERVEKRYQKDTEIVPDVNQTESEPLPNSYLKGDGNENGDGIGKENLKELIEEKLLELGERYLEQQRIKWPHIDFDFEYRTFCEKVRGSPEHYKSHESGGIRLAFQSQLRNAKSKTNGITKKQSEIINRREAFAKRHGSSTNGQGI